MTPTRFLIGALSCLCAVVIAPMLVDTRPKELIVVDGDTVRIGKTGELVRLIGFDAPETIQAKCTQERNLGYQAKRRLETLIAEGEPQLILKPCACRPGTQGTWRCNHGRSCAELRINSTDAGTILIGEGLARPYVCSATECPQREGWCR